jgi:hypothetical protein
MSSNRAALSTGARLRRRRYGTRVAAAAVIAAGLTAFFPGVSSAAQAPVGLGTADPFVVLAGQGITNANATTIIGDVGTYPNGAETGFGSVSQTGTNHSNDDVSMGAKDDLVTAYNQAAAAGPPTSVAVELGGTTLTPGVYKGATLEITGTLTLNTGGDPNAVFIFQTGSTLTTMTDSNMVVLNGGTACNVFWQVPSSATLGVNSHLIGTVLASTSIQAASGATIQGRLLAQTASITLDHNTITNAGCTTPTGEGGGEGEGGGSTTIPGGAGGTTTPPGEDTTTAGVPTGETPGESTAETPGESRTPPGITTGTVGRPPLANTGFDSQLPLIGVMTIIFGVLLMRMAKALREQRI